MRFIDGAVFRLAKDGGGGGKNEFIDAMSTHRVEQVEGIDYVVLVILGGVLHGFAHLDERSKMHDGVELVLAKYFVEYQLIGNIAMYESAMQHGIAVPAG